MRKLSPLLLLTAALTTAPVCLAQGRVSEFLGVQNWHGTVTITGTGSGSGSGGGVSDVWQYGVTSKATFQLDTYNPNIQGWTGTFTGTSAINAKDVATIGGCAQTMTQIFDGKLTPGTFTLRVEGTNQYEFYPGNYQAQGGDNEQDNSCAPGKLGGPTPVNWSPVTANVLQTLPATGFVLKGSQTMKMNSPMQPVSLAFGGDPAVIDVTVEWDIEPGLVSEDEVVVQKTPEFQNWRPTAAAGGGKGATLNLIAKLQAKGGGTTNAKVAYFIWELTTCSKEPGYAMNAPLQNPGQDFDLKIDSGSDGFYLLSTDGQKGQTLPGQLTQSSVVIAPYDWGAFGRIKVTAVMPDDSRIEGYLEGDSAQTEVRLPMRSDTSLIADVWKKSNGVEGKVDSADDEDSPQGDGHPGDGLTLYEEYRGFIEDGQHIEGNPKKKDYFVLNNAGQLYLPAIKLFQDLSGLNVHYRLKASELLPGRVVNANHGQGAHLVDQHGVVINPIAADANYAKAVGGPGTPRSISEIVAPALFRVSSSDFITYMVSSLAHELFHAANVYHHGDAGYPTVYWFKDSKTGIVTETPTSIPVTVLDESGNPYPLPYDTMVETVLGLPNDPHTGDDNCVMRYDDARGYYPVSRTPGVRYRFKPGELAGTALCTQAAGTGVNDAGRSPQPRYGDAASGRGNCRSQILVNDNVAAPKR